MATRDDSRIFVDTNVLLAATDTDRKHHTASVEFLESGLRGETRLFTNAQVMREYLVVATRPQDANGLGLSPEDACANVNRFRKLIEVLPETGETTSLLTSRIGNYGLKGKRIHDANLATTMAQHGLRKIKTYNPQDFSLFSEVEIVED